MGRDFSPEDDGYRPLDHARHSGGGKASASSASAWASCGAISVQQSLALGTPDALFGALLDEASTLEGRL